MNNVLTVFFICCILSGFTGCERSEKKTDTESTETTTQTMVESSDTLVSLDIVFTTPWGPIPVVGNISTSTDKEAIADTQGSVLAHTKELGKRGIDPEFIGKLSKAAVNSVMPIGGVGGNVIDMIFSKEGVIAALMSALALYTRNRINRAENNEDETYRDLKKIALEKDKE